MQPIKKQKISWVKIFDFTLCADQSLITEVEEETNCKRMDFYPKLMRYQLRHYRKYGEYLKF